MLGARTATHLAPNETARVILTNRSALAAADAAKVQAGIERALRKRLRNPTVVDVALTISENASGFLLVTQIRQDVEMAAFRIERTTERPNVSIGKTMIVQQDLPILDVFTVGDDTVVLDTGSVTRYEHRQRTESVPLPVAMPRDPRGRIEIEGETLTVTLPGSICRGTWKPLSLTCESGGSFDAGRNTIDGSYSLARIGGDDYAGETDGRVHIYDTSHKSAGVFDGWGSDFVAACGSTRILATGAGDRETRDSIALYEVTGRAPARASDALEFPGPVTALTASIAVARNLSTGKYEAYSLTLDCGR